MSIKQKILIAAMSVGFALCGVAGASAGPWQHAHPRRVEVNHRLAHQNFRIRHDLRDGSITRREAANLHRDDRAIRMQERGDARFDHGHITQGEKAQLNHEENGVSHQIYRDAH